MSVILTKDIIINSINKMVLDKVNYLLEPYNLIISYSDLNFNIESIESLNVDDLNSPFGVEFKFKVLGVEIKSFISLDRSNTDLLIYIDHTESIESLYNKILSNKIEYIIC